MLSLVTAVIKPFMLEHVHEALVAVGVRGMTISEVQGFGRQSGHTETYRGTEYRIDFVPKVRLEIICDPSDTETIVDVITAAARTGKIGDGKIWVTEVNQLVRVRTGELGADAI
jgi:nitrogen regulatory protein P-II 1